MSEIQKEEQPKEFDLKVTYRDEKTGLITKRDPYILRVVGEQGSNVKSRLWERPAGSGNLFDKHMNPVGRWVYEEKTVRGKVVRVGKFVEGAEHIKYVPPMTEDQKLAQELLSKDAKIAELEREMAAIKAEETKKKQVAPVQQQKKDQGA
jgi:hypothetical protein